MGKKKVLFVSQEIYPYLPETEMSLIGRHLPQQIQEDEKDIRIFMPKYGVVNERRHQLHEVIRLSRMNLIVDDFDHQLIIKVGSIQSARMQVYFIDNEDYFPKKKYFHDENGKFFPYNDERMIFFCKGVIETVRKLGWAPDIIHCHGWISALVPLYIKKLYNEDPLFNNSKVIFSVYDTDFPGELNSEMAEKLLFESSLNKKDVEGLQTPDYLSLNKIAIDYADAIIKVGKKIDKRIIKHIDASGKPKMIHPGGEDGAYASAYADFYEEFYEEVEEGELELTD
ncbi:MAG TPA: glycogen/starch synthase [Flavobacteriales bacterium]|jgi:starch synthase|nr:glycogen/starch synthase [Flavobacteriales bacterium]|tara:strand:- start:3066 stop:3914 length:849 start_codon:yes stop_codon:yes gene_type:complete